jgi:hypothetical protein
MALPGDMPAGVQWGHADRTRIHTVHLPAGSRQGRRQLYDGRLSTVRATHSPRRQCLRQWSRVRLARVPAALAYQARARCRVCGVGAAAGIGARHDCDLERRPGAASAEVRPALRPALAACAARKACCAPSRASPRFRWRSRSAWQTATRASCCRAVLVLLLAGRRPGDRRPRPELHGQCLGWAELRRRDGLPLSGPISASCRRCLAHGPHPAGLTDRSSLRRELCALARVDRSGTESRAGRPTGIFSVPSSRACLPAVQGSC